MPVEWFCIPIWEEPPLWACEPLDYLQDMAAQYNNLEMDLASGERGSRYIHVEDLLVQLTGARRRLWW